MREVFISGRWWILWTFFGLAFMMLMGWNQYYIIRTRRDGRRVYRLKKRITNAGMMIMAFVLSFILAVLMSVEGMGGAQLPVDAAYAEVSGPTGVMPMPCIIVFSVCYYGIVYCVARKVSQVRKQQLIHQANELTERELRRRNDDTDPWV